VGNRKEYDMSVLRERQEVQKMLQAMKVRYLAPKPMRLDNQFLWVTCYVGLGWRFCKDTRRWLNGYETPVSDYTFFVSCRSVRAFRRHLKKAPAGIEFVLCSRFVGKDVIGFGKKSL
jgi:hypothetical protein